jgi:hypothetical protein
MFKSARDRHRTRQLKYRTPFSELLVTGGPACLTFNEYINSQSTAPHQHLRNTSVIRLWCPAPPRVGVCHAPSRRLIIPSNYKTTQLFCEASD